MPDFLLVGAAFSGTNLLLGLLDQHPQICASPIRETNYFVSKELGTEGVSDMSLLARPRSTESGEFEAASVARVANRRDYERCYQAAYKPGAIRFGEASPAYLYYPEAPRHIAEQVPDCKIVVLLRDPMERLLAHYTSFYDVQGREHLSLEDALEQEEQRLSENWAFHWAYFGLSNYTPALMRYLARFPLPQIHLVRAEDIHHPETWRALLEFLAVDSDFPLPAFTAPDTDFPPFDPSSTNISPRTRHALAKRLQSQTNFYHEVFSEAPFRQAALRRLVAGGASSSACSAWRTNAGGSVGGTTNAGTAFQYLLFTSDYAREPLYHRKISHNHSAHPRIAKAGGMNFLKDEVISFDGFYNAFFESLVAERTGIPSIQLHLEFTGHFFVEVLRFAQGRAPQLVASTQSERRHEDGSLILEVDLSTDSPLGSRLALHLTCLSKDGRFSGGHWWATTAPRRAVQLDILACTYKKREFIERTVRRVADYRRLAREDYFITVTDNASDLPLDLFPYPNVRIVHQGNVGGAGGAARGMIEGMAAEGRPAPTHFLLMDDDIELEPDMVLRAMSWLRYVKVDQCIGGGMLDLYRPTHLHELGSIIGTPTLLAVKACVSEMELAPLGALDQLGVLPEPHYNAWWFMAISRDAVEKNGLPLPCFIRGDDKEFGYRMRERGIPTLSVPGIGVWHMPFYAKVSAWLYYYNMYNDLLICSLRHPKLTGETLAKSIAGDINHYLRKLEYDQAAMRIHGLEDFLLGPEWLLESDPQERFKQTMTTAKKYAPEHRKNVEPHALCTHYEPPSDLDKRWRRRLHNGHLALKWRKPVHTENGLPRKVMMIQDWSWTDVTYSDEIGIKHPLVSGITVFRKQPEVYFDLYRRVQKCLAILRIEWPQRAAAFRAHDAEFTSPAFWRHHLGMIESERTVVSRPEAASEKTVPLAKPLVPAMAGF